MDFTSLFNMQGMMFCILALGWYLRKSGMIDKSGKALLSSLVMNVTLPASIVKSFQMEFSMNILKLTLEVIVISFLIQIFSNLLSRVLYPGWSEESKKVLQYATIVSNAGILETPSLRESSEIWESCMRRSTRSQRESLCGRWDSLILRRRRRRKSF